MVAPKPRRRPTAVALLQQSALLADLLRHASPAALRHHAPEVERFFLTLQREALLTHSVLPGLGAGEFPHPDELLGPGPAVERVVAEPARARALLESLVERRAKIALRPS